MLKILGYTCLIIVIIAVIFISRYPHKDDARLQAECEAKGGVFIEARSPLHVCVQPIE